MASSLLAPVSSDQVSPEAFVHLRMLTAIWKKDCLIDVCLKQLLTGQSGLGAARLYQIVDIQS